MTNSTFKTSQTRPRSAVNDNGPCFPRRHQCRITRRSCLGALPAYGRTLLLWLCGSPHNRPTSRLAAKGAKHSLTSQHGFQGIVPEFDFSLRARSNKWGSLPGSCRIVAPATSRGLFFGSGSSFPAPYCMGRWAQTAVSESLSLWPRAPGGTLAGPALLLPVRLHES